MSKSVITFASVYHAFRAKRLLQSGGIEVELIPIPRHLSGSCEGLAAKLKRTDMAKAVELLETNKIDMLKTDIPLEE
jgi:uncharacterized SAM-binding protein YcdF (DUF218 family)